MWKRDVIHKTGSTYHIALPPEDWDTATGNVDSKFGEMVTRGF